MTQVPNITPGAVTGTEGKPLTPRPYRDEDPPPMQTAEEQGTITGSVEGLTPPEVDNAPNPDGSNDPGALDEHGGTPMDPDDLEAGIIRDEHGNAVGYPGATGSSVSAPEDTGGVDPQPGTSDAPGGGAGAPGDAAVPGDGK